MYPPEEHSDQSSELLLAELIREQVLNRTREEIPHSVEVKVGEIATREDGLVTIRAEIWAETESQKGILIGKKGAKVEEIGTASRRSLEGELGAKVHLDLKVRVRNRWRRDEDMLDRLGIEWSRPDPLRRPPHRRQSRAANPLKCRPGSRYPLTRRRAPACPPGLAPQLPAARSTPTRWPGSTDRRRDSAAAGGALEAGQPTAPWASSNSRPRQQDFARSFSGGADHAGPRHGGRPSPPPSARPDQTQDAEAPSLDFAGSGRTGRGRSGTRPRPTSATSFAGAFDRPRTSGCSPARRDSTGRAVAVPDHQHRPRRREPCPRPGAPLPAAGSEPGRLQEPTAARVATRSSSRGHRPRIVQLHRVIAGRHDALAAPLHGSAGSRSGSTGSRDPSPDAWRSALDVDPARDAVELDVAFAGQRPDGRGVRLCAKGAGTVGQREVAAKAVRVAPLDASGRRSSGPQPAAAPARSRPPSVVPRDSNGAHGLHP